VFDYFSPLPAGWAWCWSLLMFLVPPLLDLVPLLPPGL
jgi:hypothetical protein